MTISKRTASGLEEVLRTLLLDSENKVPADRLRIVGALSAGAIVESGENANGHYVRFVDGTQMCWRFISLAGQTVGVGTQPFGGWTFPAAFAEIPSIHAHYTGQNSPSIRATIEGTNLSQGGSIYLSNNVGQVTTPTYGGIHLLAVGVWK